MDDNTILIIIAVVAGIAIIAVAAYHIARYMRGSIKLSLTQTAFDPGSSITGSFELTTRKAIEGKQLVVSLIGVEVTEIRKNDKTETRRHEIFRNEKLIEKERDYQAGFVKTYDFEIPAPKLNAPEFLNSPVGSAIAAAASVLTNRRTLIQWKLEARLVAKGIDLVGSKKISINPE
jgi:predicted small secreted protein